MTEEKMIEEKVNMYCKEYINWLGSRQDEGIEFSFVYNNLKEFYLVSKIVEDNLRDYENIRETEYDINDFSKIDFFDKITIIKNFFKNINMKIDVEKCINDGTIEPFIIDFKIDNIKQYMKGHGRADEKGNVDVMFPNSGLVLDMVVMMHELAHFPHKLTIDCEEPSFISEAIALYTELQSYDYLNNLGYVNEAKFFKGYRMKRVYGYSKKYTSLISILLTYINFGSLSKENFIKMFDDKDYYETLKDIESREDFYIIEGPLHYILGLLLATYMYGTVKNDFSFTENINILNKNLNNFSFENSLKILGISSFDKETIIKLSSSMDEYNNVKEAVKK